MADRVLFRRQALLSLRGCHASLHVIARLREQSTSDGESAGAGAASSPVDVDVEMEELCNDFAAVLESERAAGHALSFLVNRVTVMVF